MAQTVSDVMTRNPVAVRRDDSVARAAQLMRDHDTGEVVVAEDGQIMGVLTDRDIAVRVVAREEPPSTPVGDASSEDEIAMVSPQTSLDSAASTMRSKAVRRLPVVEGGTLVGVVSIGDLAIERDPRSGLADISAAEPNP